MQRDIHLKWFFAQKPEEVWACLTDSKLMGEWLMPNDFKPVVGHRFTFKAKPRAGWNGKSYCEVLELEPLKKISYSWRGGPSDEEVSLDSVVTWTLEAKGEGTELRLAHTGFRGLKNYFVSMVMEKGWKKIVGTRFTYHLNQLKHAA